MTVKHLVLKNRPGHDALWEWFSLSRSSFAVMPRSLMHEMPDEWQEKMAALLREWDAAWDWGGCGFDGCRVTCYEGNRFVKTPEWVIEYRHPYRAEIEKHRAAR